MPLTWTIDPEKKLVTMIAEGEVARPEFEELDDALRAAGAHGYQKLFDGARGHMNMTPEDILMLGARVRRQHAEGPVSALAVVLQEADSRLLAPLLGMLAAAKRPMRLFRDTATARKWLQSAAEPRPEGT